MCNTILDRISILYFPASYIDNIDNRAITEMKKPVSRTTSRINLKSGIHDVIASYDFMIL